MHIRTRDGHLKITYKNKKIERICTDIEYAQKKYKFCQEMVDKIQMRLKEIASISSVEEMMQYKIGRCHKLTNNRKDQYAVDLVHPMRLVFSKTGEKTQEAIIIEIVDYH